MLFVQKFDRRVLTLIIVLLVCASGGSAQQSTGGLRGHITDQNGAVVVGTTISVIGSGGKEQTVTANVEGAYLISGLAPGKYVVRAQETGFVPYEKPDV